MNNDTLAAKPFAFAVLLATAMAVIGNVILTVLGRVVSAPPDTFGPYMYSSVIGLTVGGILAGAVVYWLMRRFYGNRAKADRHFFILAIVVLIASFYPDVALPWSTDADQVGWTYGIMANLMLMHVVAAAPVLYYFPRTKSA